MSICKLKLQNLTFQSEAASSSNTSTSQSPTSSSISNPPDVANVLAQIKSGDLVTHASKKNITSRQIQSHVCYLQRTLSFVTGIKGGWSEQAQEAFQTWLAAPKKRFTTPTTMQALTNGEVEAEGSTDTMNSQAAIGDSVENNTAVSHRDLADEITPVSPNTTNDTAPANTDDTTPANTGADDLNEPPGDASDSSSDSSSSSSPSPLAIPDISLWSSEWHDVWYESIYLLEAAETDGKKEIATRFLKNIIAAQARWDRV